MIKDNQLYFDFNNKKLDCLDFLSLFKSDYNRLAYSFLFEDFPWTNNVLYLYGASGTGKTYMSEVYLSKYEGIKVSLTDIVKFSVGELHSFLVNKSYSTIFFDDISVLNKEEEVALFNLYNFISTNSYRMIITSRLSPAEMELSLPDLDSRLKAASVVLINDLNDQELFQFFFMLLQQKQIILQDNVVHFIFKHIHRTASEVINVVNKITKYIASNNKSVTLKNIKHILNI